MNREYIYACNLGNFSLPLSSTCVGSLDEFWWMLQSASWGVSQISSPIDNCTHWDSNMAQLDTDQKLMDNPLADFIWFHEDLHPPWARSHVFCIYPGTASSSKRVRIGIELLLLLYCCYSSFEIKKRFGGNTVWCHCMFGWLLPLFYWGNLYLWSFFANFL